MFLLRRLMIAYWCLNDGYVVLKTCSCLCTSALFIFVTILLYCGITNKHTTFQ